MKKLYPLWNQFFSYNFTIDFLEKMKKAKFDGTDHIYKKFYRDWISDKRNKRLANGISLKTLKTFEGGQN